MWRYQLNLSLTAPCFGLVIITFIFQSLKVAEKHIELVTSERSFYKELIKASKETAKDFFKEILHQLPSPGAMVPANTYNMTMHYSFDMAQQVKI